MVTMLVKIFLLFLYLKIKEGRALSNAEDASPNIAPYRVSLMVLRPNGQKLHLAEGSIISENRVLTSATDLVGLPTENLTVVAGIALPPSANETQEQSEKNVLSSYIAIYKEYFICILTNALYSAFPFIDSQSSGQTNGVSNLLLYSCDVNLTDDQIPAIEEPHNVSSIVIHEDYNPKSYKNNIAIVYITDTFKFSDTIQPIRLASVARQTGDECLVVGGGQISFNGTTSDSLQMATSKIDTLERCNLVYRRYKKTLPITDSQICVMFEKSGQGICIGDRGAPLVNNNELVGFAAFGVLCGFDYPDVFTNVTSYLDWIKSH